MAAKNDKKPQHQTYPDCPTCSKTNHSAEKCWRGAGAHLRLKRSRQNTENAEASGDEKTSTDNY